LFCCPIVMLQPGRRERKWDMEKEKGVISSIKEELRDLYQLGTLTTRKLLQFPK
jgi:hypothetical protein